MPIQSEINIPTHNQKLQICHVPKHKIAKVVCHRLRYEGVRSALLPRVEIPHPPLTNAKVQNEEIEEYLCKWKIDDQAEYHPFTWHRIEELPAQSYHRIQHYIDGFKESSHGRINPLKRKSPENDDPSVPSDIKALVESRSSSNPVLSDSTHLTTDWPPNVTNNEPNPDANEYNCTLVREDGKVQMSKVLQQWKSSEFPTTEMTLRASKTIPRKADYLIQAEFKKRLAILSAENDEPKVVLVNDLDSSSPPLNFKFISENRLGEGVFSADADTLEGCGHVAGRKSGGFTACRADMGQGIGCEYSTLCGCLEYASTDEARMTSEQKEMQARGELMGLPKRFPYHNPKGQKGGRLVGFYLKSRSPVYECNPKCACGPGCKTRVVQHGRTIPLEIFKTRDRGWGLRSPVDIAEGQFIDTYRGEIITDEEADAREERAKRDNGRSNKAKGVYLYTLDKFAPDNVSYEECYTIDGEHLGGPTRFINHSCEPNCQQHTVSYNKNDYKIYELAFFAWRRIPAYEELVFDYLDKDDPEAAVENEPASRDESAVAVDCKCGSARCRGKLWI